MVKTASTMKKIGTPASDFKLLNVDGQMVGLHDFDDQPGLLVMFICNHCPFVKHVADWLDAAGDAITCPRESPSSPSTATIRQRTRKIRPSR